MALFNISFLHLFHSVGGRLHILFQVNNGCTANPRHEVYPDEEYPANPSRLGLPGVLLKARDFHDQALKALDKQNSLEN